MTTERIIASARRTRALDVALAGLLLAAMTGVLCLSAWLVGGDDAVMVALGLVVCFLVFVPRLPLATLMGLRRAVPIPPFGGAEDLYQVCAALAGRAGLDQLPVLYWLPERGINAMAVRGAEGLAVAVSDGALRMLGRREMRAVLAHELSHLAAGDADWMWLTEGIAAITRVTAVLGLGCCLIITLFDPDGTHMVPVWVLLVFALAAPVIEVLRLALARRREFAADLGAVALTGDAWGLAVALDKIEQLERGLWWPWQVMRVVTPLPQWLRTHPSTRERIERLAAHGALAAQSRLPPPLPFGRACF